MFHRMEKQFDGRYMKKGRWTAEEDEVLMNHVRKNGPKDWSSIPSKGLLPRTGKSCRLRWFNKLRPNLKSGCKFSAEEERVVIELQAQVGNKWAKIATYLPGRTDNDVKNFWSSRRKRLERILQRPSSSSSSRPQKHKGKAPIVNQAQDDEVQPCSSNHFEENISCCNWLSNPIMGNCSEVFKMVMLQNLTKPNFGILETDLSVVEAMPLHMVPSFESSSDYNFPQPPEPKEHFPLLSECQDVALDPFGSNLLEVFEQQLVSESECSQKLETKFPTLGLEGNAQSSSLNGLFEDFQTDMFDYFEKLPTSSKQ